MGDASRSLSVRFDVRGEREIVITVESDDGSENSEIISVRNALAAFYDKNKGKVMRCPEIYLPLSTQAKRMLWFVLQCVLFGNLMTQYDEVLVIDHVTGVERSESFNNYYFCVRLHALTLTVGPGFD